VIRIGIWWRKIANAAIYRLEEEGRVVEEEPSIDGCGIQSEACCGLNFDITTSHQLSGLPPKPQNSPPTCRGASL
jgi:hypothetical protein